MNAIPAHAKTAVHALMVSIRTRVIAFQDTWDLIVK